MSAPAGAPAAPSTRRRLTRDAPAAIAAQAIEAGGSFVIQLVTARTLGAAGYGEFAILFSLLVLVTAVLGAWVGDSVIVLDRRAPRVSGAIAFYQLVLTVLGVVVAVVAAGGTGLTDGGETVLFALLTVGWLCEELGRRVFMARLEFWKLVVNDAVYVVVALGSIAALRASTGDLTLSVVLGGMAIGTLASVVAAVVQLPRSELTPGPVTREGLAEVAGFGAWRSAQAAARPLGNVLMRAIVAWLASAAALGQVEAARLLVAPVFIFSNGVGVFLLPFLTERERRGGTRRRALLLLSAAATGCVVLYGVVAMVFVEPMSNLLTAGEIDIDRIAVLGWLLLAGAYVAGLPATNVVVARRQAQWAFTLRAADVVVGLAAVVVAEIVLGASWTPWGLAVGAVIGSALLVRAAGHPPAPDPAAPAPVA